MIQRLFAGDLDQVWGEVATLEAQGASNRLPPELWEEAGKAQAARRESNDYTDRLAKFLDDVPDGKILKADVYELVGLKNGARQYQREHIREAMEELGWSDGVAKLGGKSARVFIKAHDADAPISTYGLYADENGRRVFGITAREPNDQAFSEYLFQPKPL